MTKIADSKEKYQLQNRVCLKPSIRTRHFCLDRASGNCRMAALTYFSQEDDELTSTGATKTQITIQERSRLLPSQNNRKAAVDCCHWR